MALTRRELVRSTVVLSGLALPAWTRLASAGDGAVAALAQLLDGEVVASGSAGYASARRLWDSRFDRLRPRAVAYCANAADVERVVRWGKRHRVRVAPRSGGHSYGGYSSGNGVVVADVSRLNTVGVSAGRATVGAGAKLIDVYAALWQHGLTIPGGSCASVGIAGLALGGGVGYSSRLLGTTADNLAHLRIVTADGLALACDASHHGDLFWACRGGGGGNFGVVTELTFATHPVSGVSRYEIEWPWAQAETALAAWQDFAPHAPDELFSVLDLIATDPSVPGARAHVVSAGQYFGSEADLASLIAPLASTGTPTRVVTRTLSYLDAVLHWAGCRDAGACADRRVAFAAKSDYVAKPLPAGALGGLVAAVTARQGQGPAAIYLDAYGGAINRVPVRATAFVHRDALYSIQYTAQWNGDPASSMAWLQGVYAQMRPFVSGSAYQNYIDPRLPNWQHAYYGANLPRLKAVKRKFDPRNAFRFAQSIPPARAR
jgi:FAD/FMN-containing dehydrogenase